MPRRGVAFLSGAQQIRFSVNSRVYRTRPSLASSPFSRLAGAVSLRAGALAAIGVRRMHPGAYLNEFVVQVPDAPMIHRLLLERGFLAGLALADAEPDDPLLADGLLLCATEVTTSEEIARFAAAMHALLPDDAATSSTGPGATAGAAR